MKFKLIYTSDWKNEKTREIELNSLEELLKLQMELDQYLVLHDDQTLEVYDDYRE